MDKVRKTAEGKVEVLCGGYVSYDVGRMNEGRRETEEIRVWMPIEGGNFDDCGYWTNLLCKALEDKVRKHFKGDRNRHPTCLECWRY
jgi:hypothetical protein